MALPVFSPEHTLDGELPPWEIAKAFAFHVVLSDVAKHLGMGPKDLVDGRAGSYIASKVLLKGGGHPTERSIQKTIARQTGIQARGDALGLADHRPTPSIRKRRWHELRGS